MDVDGSMGRLTQALVATLVAFVGLAGNVSAQESECTVSYAQYQALNIGTSYAQVSKVLGCDGIETVRTESPGINMVLYEWSGRGGALVTATFQNGRLDGKVQVGLTVSECIVSFAQYQALKIGMSYVQVSKVLGCDGIETAHMSFNTVLYDWPGRAGGFITATFQNGRLLSKTQVGLK